MGGRKGEETIKITDFLTIPRGELTFSASRSSGPGGQNVNKVNTQVTLKVPLDQLGLSVEELERAATALAGRCNGEGELVLGSSQGLLFWEFDGPRDRKVHIQIISN